jgi:hypothetical protein
VIGSEGWRLEAGGWRIWTLEDLEALFERTAW